MMTPEVLGGLGIAAGVVLVALGGFKAIAMIVSKQTTTKKTSVPPNHGPCNEAVDRLADSLEKNIDEQRAFRETFVMWMAREEGYRNGQRSTGERATIGD
jgi:hypothetical protein